VGSSHLEGTVGLEVDKVEKPSRFNRSRRGKNGMVTTQEWFDLDFKTVPFVLSLLHSLEIVAEFMVQHALT
jgi:hypothetical protein